MSAVMVLCRKDSQIVSFQSGILLGNTVITVYNDFFALKPQLNEVSIAFTSDNKTMKTTPTDISYYHSKKLLNSFKELFSSQVDNLCPIIGTSPIYLATFVKLKCSENSWNKYVYSRDNFTEGENLLVSFNSLFAQPFCFVSGIVSSILKSSPNIILTDAKTSVGFQGSPIHRRNLLNGKTISGMILRQVFVSFGLPPVQKLSGFSLGIHLSAIDDLLSDCVFDLLSPKQLLPPPCPFQSFDFLAYIFNESCIGSGLVISEDGIMITNGHVVNFISGGTVKVFLNNHELTGKVLFSTERLSKLDFAVLEIIDLDKNEPLSCCVIAERFPTHGERVYSIGHLVDGIRPIQIISEGVVSFTNKHEFMLMDSVCVPSCSGGGVMEPGGQLLGLIFAGLERTDPEVGDDMESSKLQLGISVPLYYFRKPLQNFVKTRDIKILKKMADDYDSNYYRAKL